VTRKLRDIMSPAPACLAPTATVFAAAEAMRERGVSTVLVLTEGKLSGLVTARDITVQVLAENRDPHTVRIGEICSPQVTVLDPDDGIDVAARLARQHVMRRIPVWQHGLAVGVVCVDDLTWEQDEVALRAPAQAVLADL
jgi:CBS domain-containing protein